MNLATQIKAGAVTAFAVAAQTVSAAQWSATGNIDIVYDPYGIFSGTQNNAPVAMRLDLADSGIPSIGQGSGSFIDSKGAVVEDTYPTKLYNNGITGISMIGGNISFSASGGEVYLGEEVFGVDTFFGITASDTPGVQYRLDGLNNPNGVNYASTVTVYGEGGAYSFANNGPDQMPFLNNGYGAIISILEPRSTGGFSEVAWASIHFSKVNITQVPEPHSVALGVVGAGAVLLCASNRSDRNRDVKASGPEMRTRE
jgi:hypothetical protein